MGKTESVDIILGILYALAAVMFFVVSYMYFIKRYKRNKMLAVNDVTLTTSRYDNYDNKTQFLIELSRDLAVTLKLLDENEQEVATLLEKEIEAGENVIDFDPMNYQDGIYYLSLKTEGTTILRRISIKNQ
ncbi:MAG: hypothetical protein P8I55_02025 [Crocinitomix sp.]|nr:hypothetical protein [Crocinitomix sp.]